MNYNDSYCNEIENMLINIENSERLTDNVKNNSPDKAIEEKTNDSSPPISRVKGPVAKALERVFRSRSSSPRSGGPLRSPTLGKRRTSPHREVIEQSDEEFKENKSSTGDSNKVLLPSKNFQSSMSKERRKLPETSVDGLPPSEAQKVRICVDNIYSSSPEETEMGLSNNLKDYNKQLLSCGNSIMSTDILSEGDLTDDEQSIIHKENKKKTSMQRHLSLDANIDKCAPTTANDCRLKVLRKLAHSLQGSKEKGSHSFKEEENSSEESTPVLMKRKTKFNEFKAKDSEDEGHQDEFSTVPMSFGKKVAGVRTKLQLFTFLIGLTLGSLFP